LLRTSSNSPRSHLRVSVDANSVDPQHLSCTELVDHDIVHVRARTDVTFAQHTEPGSITGYGSDDF